MTLRATDCGLLMQGKKMEGQVGALGREGEP